jgi:hypothetical protein
MLGNQDLDDKSAISYYPDCYCLTMTSLYVKQVEMKDKMTKLSLCIIKHYAIKMYGGTEAWLQASLILAPDGAE